jgi:hypothetical protein
MTCIRSAVDPAGKRPPTRTGGAVTRPTGSDFGLHAAGPLPSIRTMRCAILCGGAALLLLASCSDARQARFSTRYLPPASSLDYDVDYKELPHQTPALEGEFRGTTADNEARPHAESEIKMVGVETMPGAGASYQTY